MFAYRHFEFPQTQASMEFFQRHPTFYDAFLRLFDLGTKFFGRTVDCKSCADLIAFNLGMACREDLIEVSFMAVSDYGMASSKLLRGLYERAVTLAYIIKHPEKAERFVKYGAVQKHKMLNETLKLVTEAEYDKLRPNETAAQIRHAYAIVKNDFQEMNCKKCGTKRLAFKWDAKDIASMAKDVGEPYIKYYMAAYALGNLTLHATLVSTMQFEDEGKQKLQQERRGARVCVRCAIALFIEVLKSQNRHFNLDLEDEIRDCAKQFHSVWPKPEDTGSNDDLSIAVE